MSRPFFDRKTAQGRLCLIAYIACYSYKLSVYDTISVSKNLMSQALTEKYEKNISWSTRALHKAIMTFAVFTGET